MRFIAIIMGGLLLSTAVMAAATQANLSPTSKATAQEISPQEKLKLLKEIHPHNEVFDNHHTGGIPYEPPATQKGK